jgi:hypothetical protein
MHCTCSVLLDLISLFGEQYTLGSSSIYSFLYPPITSSLFGLLFSSETCSQISSVYVLQRQRFMPPQHNRQSHIFVYIHSKYQNFFTLSKDPSTVFMLWSCLAFWWWDINMNLFFFTFTNRPFSLLASAACVFLYGVYVISQEIYIISIKQKLVCPI